MFEDFTFQSPGPILLDLGLLKVRWYGFLYAVAFLTGLWVAPKIVAKRIEVNEKIGKDSEHLAEYKKFLDKEEISNFAFVGLISGLIGARLLFVILNLDYFMSFPLEAPQIWLGGQCIQGGIVGGIIGTLVYQYYSNKKDAENSASGNFTKSYLFKLSSFACLMPLAQAIGRWGNFFNEEAFGFETGLPWKLYISHLGTFHHPTFLYESIWNLLSFAVMILLVRRALSSTTLIASYLIAYSVGRFLIEPIRTDSLMIGDIPSASLISVVFIIFAILVLLIKNKLAR